VQANYLIKVNKREIETKAKKVIQRGKQRNSLIKNLVITYSVIKNSAITNSVITD
jgi:hypothetical protein